jgi:hypothetical protein
MGPEPSPVRPTMFLRPTTPCVYRKALTCGLAGFTPGSSHGTHHIASDPGRVTPPILPNFEFSVYAALPLMS